MYSYSREAVRVKVKKCEMNSPPEWRKFSVDPQITSVEVLHSILAKAFEIRSDFAIYYRTFDPVGHETFLAVLSDWDLDAAFLRTHNYSVQTGCEPCLNLRVDVSSLSDTINMHKNLETSKSEHSTFQQSIGAGQKYVQNMQNKLPGLIMNQMEKTFSMVQRALNFAEEQIPVYPPKPPLSDSEFRTFLDSVGQIIRPHELRHVIFLGGIDPSLRRVVWKHILNVYPNGMTGRERMDYIKKKAKEYYKLRDVWKTAVQVGSSDSELAYVTSMVKKDVLRTDRLQQFYAGNDDNQNIASLFNILTTYALNHPKVSYCQGMSDLASPLLVTMNDEAHAYICFCAIMERLQSNFMLDGIAMTQKFSHLTEALQYYDAEFYNYLKLQQADDLLFCYRWLLLELKREFPFEDSLRMLEVQWSSLRSDPPDKELKLFDKEFVPQNESTDGAKHINQNPLETISVQRKHRENHYANICALRRQTSSVSLYSNVSINQNNYNLFSEDPNSTKLNRFKRLNHSLDENVSRVPFRRTYLMKAHKSLDEAKMLLIMKNISPYENYIDSLNSIGHFNEKKNSGDNELHSTCDKPKNESKKIIFHSTNPFLNDAQGGSTEVLVYDDKNELNNFQNIQSHLENKVINGIENIENSDKNLLNELNKLNYTDSESIISAQILNKHRGHFKELKEKIAASQKGILTSIDKTESQFKAPPTNLYDDNCYDDKKYSNLSPKKSQKVVKNLNEFLNFTNSSRISDKLAENSNKFLKSNNFESNNKNYKCIMIANECGDVLTNGRPIVNLTSSSSDASFVIKSNFNSSTKFEKLQNIKNDECFELKKNINTTENFVNDNIQILKKNEQGLQVINSPLSKSCSTFSESMILDEKCLKNVNIGYEKLVKNIADSLNIEKEIIYDNTDLVKQEENIQPNIHSLGTNNSDVYLWENPLHQISRNSIGSLSDMDINDNKYSFNRSLEKNLINQVEDFGDNSKSKITKVKKNLECDKNNLQLITTTADQNLQFNPEKFVNIKANIFSNTVNSETYALEKNNIEKSSLNPFFSELREEESLVYQNRYNTSKINIENSESLISNDIVNSNDKSKIEQLNHDNFTISSVHNEEYSSKYPSNVDIKTFLPPPKDFGGGNPFLIFLCLTLLLQHRNIIMRNNLDYNEMAMHFDKMVRKHDVNRVLNQARRMYFEYLKTHNSLANTNSSIVSDNTRSNLINLERKS